MTTFTPNSTLADIVTARPSLARTLEARGLDYCCGGSTTLEDACAAHNLDADAVLADLTTAGAAVEVAPAWATMSAAELVDHIETTHHAYLSTEMPRLTALAEKVVSVHGERHPELTETAACYATIRADLEPHLAREEQVLFPMIRELARASGDTSFDRGALQKQISMMLAEHDTVGELLARLRDLTDGYRPPDDACASYDTLFAGFAELEADTHLHVHKENNVLVPAVGDLERRLP